MSWLGIMIGGAFGSILRYWCTLLWPARWHYLTAVWLVNLVGVVVLALLAVTHTSHLWHDALSVGVLGGLTTFSSMIAETTTRRHRLIYLALQLVPGVLGYMLIMAIWG